MPTESQLGIYWPQHSGHGPKHTLNTAWTRLQIEQATRFAIKINFKHEDSVADPDPRSGVFFTLGSGMGKKSEYGFGMNKPDHISESLETIFWVKILKFFDGNPGSKKFGSGLEKIRIRIRNTAWRYLQCFRCFGSELVSMWVRIPVFDDQKVKKIYSWYIILLHQKLQFTYT
jgi:hypothetical protein